MITTFLVGDTASDRIVPRTGPSAWLTGFTAAAMAFLAVFTLSVSLAANRLADRWSGALAGRATIGISAAPEAMAVQTRLVLDILSVTPGVASARPLDPVETRTLLAPWFGTDLPLDDLPVPQMIDIEETANGFDAAGLKLRLAAEVPEAVLDDHRRWRRPLVTAADRIRTYAYMSLLLISGATAAMVTLSAQAALASNDRVIGVLRLIGARDTFITRAFVRRSTFRAVTGAGIGTLVGTIAVALLPRAAEEGGFLSGLGFTGWQWALPLAIPILTAIIAFWATRTTALRMLRKIK